MFWHVPSYAHSYLTKINHSLTWGYWIKVTEKLVVITQESKPWQAKLSWSKWWVRRLLRDEKCIWQFWVIVEQWLLVQSREVCGCGLPGPWSERLQWNGSYPKLWGDNILISHLLLFVCPSAHTGHRLGLTQLLFQGEKPRNDKIYNHRFAPMVLDLVWKDQIDTRYIRNFNIEFSGSVWTWPQWLISSSPFQVLWPCLPGSFVGAGGLD